MTDVFISYARADRNAVRLIASALTAEGYAVWWDPAIKPGAKWDAMIRKALANAAVVLTCWSKAAVNSKWVLAETTYGDGAKKLVPVMVQSCSPPIPYNMVQTADLTRWRGDGDDAEWTAALSAVRTLVEAKRRLAGAAPPAGEAHGAAGLARTGGLAGGGGLGLEARGDEIPVGLSYRPSAGRAKLGPRGWQIALGAVVATVALTALLYGGSEAWRRFGPAAPGETAALPDAGPGPSTPISAPSAPAAPEIAAPAPQAPVAPGPTAPDPSLPEPVAPTVTPPPVTTTPATTPVVRTPTTPAVSVDPAVPVTSLEACLGQFASLCRTRRAAGFAQDATLSVQERSALAALGVNAASPTQSGFDQCRKAYGALSPAERTAQTHPPGSILGLICGSSGTAAPATPGVRPVYPAPTPDRQRDPLVGVDPSTVRDVINRLPQPRDPPPLRDASPAGAPTDPPPNDPYAGRRDGRDSPGTSDGPSSQCGPNQPC